MWQVGPAGRARMSTASASQSSSRPTTASVLPLVSPLRQSVPARARVEVRLAGPQRRLERLGVLPADHEDPPVGRVLDDRRDEPVRAEAHGRRIERSRAVAAAIRPPPRPSRTGTPAAAMAALTAAIEWMSRWKIEAARTASAWPSVIAATMSAGEPAPPEAMTGTLDARGHRAQQLEVEARLRPVAVDRGEQDLAGAQLHGPLDPRDGVEAGRLAAALDDDLPRAGRLGPRARIDAR